MSADIFIYYYIKDWLHLFTWCRRISFNDTTLDCKQTIEEYWGVNKQLFVYSSICMALKRSCPARNRLNRQVSKYKQSNNIGVCWRIAIISNCSVNYKTKIVINFIKYFSGNLYFVIHLRLQVQHPRLQHLVAN